MAYTGTGKTLWAHPSVEEPFFSLKKAFVLALVIEASVFAGLYYIKASGMLHIEQKKPPMKVVPVPPKPPEPEPIIEKPPEPIKPKVEPKVEKIVDKPLPKEQVKEQPKPEDTAPVPLEQPAPGPSTSSNANSVALPTAVGDKTTNNNPVAPKEPAKAGPDRGIRPLKKAEWVFPRDLLAEDLSGTVKAHVYINPDGTVREVKIISSTEPRFNRHVQKTLMKYVFHPSDIERIGEYEINFKVDTVGEAV
ncbi:energy transducer TonB [Chitinimonas lacunae]|uniref:Protein TonB n=1 Tax=Chitinimonas lacunae TaxID=1963018 RepID=A0ABV8MX83_9NEIS